MGNYRLSVWRMHGYRIPFHQVKMLCLLIVSAATQELRKTNRDVGSGDSCFESFPVSQNPVYVNLLNYFFNHRSFCLLRHSFSDGARRRSISTIDYIRCWARCFFFCSLFLGSIGCFLFLYNPLTYSQKILFRRLSTRSHKINILYFLYHLLKLRVFWKILVNKFNC